MGQDSVIRGLYRCQGGTATRRLPSDVGGVSLFTDGSFKLFLWITGFCPPCMGSSLSWSLICAYKMLSQDQQVPLGTVTIRYISSGLR